MLLDRGCSVTLDLRSSSATERSELAGGEGLEEADIEGRRETVTENVGRTPEVLARASTACSAPRYKYSVHYLESWINTGRDLA